MSSHAKDRSRWAQFSESSLGQNLWSIDAVSAVLALAVIIPLGMWQPVFVKSVAPLYAELALGGAVLAVSLTVLSVFAAISSDDYLAIVSASVGMKEVIRPYRVVAYVSGVLIIETLLGAIVWQLAFEWSKVWLIGIGTALSVWAVVGTCQLVSITVGHVQTRTELPQIRTSAREAMKRLNSGEK